MAATDPLIGTKMGDYTIQSILGRGGMARVYLGYDENLQRYAAVKVIDSNLLATDDRDEYFERFQREARSIARLRHPNIVGIYQFGQENEDYYMAMVFIEGQDLRAVMKSHAREHTLIPHELVLKVMRAMTQALDYAHEQGVIHRDVKPSNILVMRDGTAVLTDFGLALSVPEGTIGNTFGSAHYIAPEQAVSSAQAVPQSDLYSLGVVLYEMLTGRVPFDDSSAMSVALKHLSDPPPPLTHINPEISHHVEDVVMKSLEKEPVNRYETGAALYAALERAFTLSDDDDTHQLSVAVADARPRPPGQTDPWSKLLDEEPGPETAVSVPSPVDLASGMSRPSQLDPVMARTSAKLHELDQNDQRRSRLLMIGVVLLVLLLAIGGGAVGLMLLGPGAAATTPTAAAVVVTELGTEEATEAVIEAATEVPTDTPTQPPTDAGAAVGVVTTEEATPPPTEALTEPPTDTATPAPTEDERPRITLNYDERTVVLHNSSGLEVNVSGLVFVQERDDTPPLDFNASDWARNTTRSPSRLPANDCFQVWTTRFNFLEPAAYCQNRHSWRSTAPRNAFWIADDPDAVFEVRLDGETLAVCRIGDETCQVPVPPSG